MDAHENAKDIAVISERMTNIADDQRQLAKSYKVLNDHHGELDTKFTKMETEWSTTKDLIRWLVGGSAMSLLVGIIQLLKIFEII